MQPVVLASQRCDALREQGEAVFVQRLFDARSPARLAAAGLQPGIAVQPPMHPVAPALLGRVAGGVCGLQHRGRGVPQGMHCHQADAGADAHALVLVNEAIANGAQRHSKQFMLFGQRVSQLTGAADRVTALQRLRGRRGQAGQHVALRGVS